MCQQLKSPTTCEFMQEHFQTPSWPSNYSEFASVYEQSTHKKEFSNFNRLSLLVVTNDEDSDYNDPYSFKQLLVQKRATQIGQYVSVER